MSAPDRRVWLFDLDNTLHDANPYIFPHINSAMTAYVAQRAGLDEAAASALRETYWRRYGATLLGLIRDHRIKPARCILVEDSAENLKTAKRLGMRTIWISGEKHRPAWVDLRLESVLELPRRLGALG